MSWVLEYTTLVVRGLAASTVDTGSTLLAGNLDTAMNLLLWAFRLALNSLLITSLVLNRLGSMFLAEKAPILNFEVLSWMHPLPNLLLKLELPKYDPEVVPEVEKVEEDDFLFLDESEEWLILVGEFLAEFPWDFRDLGRYL